MKVEFTLCVDSRAAASIQVYLAFAQRLMPRTTHMLEVEHLMHHIGSMIDQASAENEIRAKVVPFPSRGPEPPTAA